MDEKAPAVGPMNLQDTSSTSIRYDPNDEDCFIVGSAPVTPRHDTPTGSVTPPRALRSPRTSEGSRNTTASQHTPSQLTPNNVRLPKQRAKGILYGGVSRSIAGSSTGSRPKRVPGKRALSENDSISRFLEQATGNSHAAEHTDFSRQREQIDVLPSREDDVMPDGTAVDAIDVDNAFSVASTDGDAMSIASTPSRQPRRSSGTARAHPEDPPFKISMQLKTFLSKPTSVKISNKTGYVYILKDARRPDLRKIGCSEDPPTMRCKAIEKTCRIGELSIVENQQIPHRQFKRVERIVHIELAHFKRPWFCETCLKSHREWFEIDDDVAISTVQRWMRFAQQEPWREPPLETRDKVMLKQLWKNKLDVVVDASDDEQHNDHETRRRRWEAFTNFTMSDWVRYACWHVTVRQPAQVKKGALWDEFLSDWWRLWALAVTVLHLISCGILYRAFVFCLTGVAVYCTL